MLAQNFMTATDLGIAEAEVSALIKVLGMLERGELSKRFAMETTMMETPCGTVACICGWAHLVSNGAAFPEAIKQNCGNDFNERLPREAIHLFGYDSSPNNLESRTVAQAASALRNYLTLGEARWVEVLGTAHAEQSTR